MIYFRRKLLNSISPPSSPTNALDKGEKARFHHLKHVVQTGTPGQIQQGWSQWRKDLAINMTNSEAQSCEARILQQINALLANQYGLGEDKVDKTALMKEIVQLRTLIQRQQRQALSLQPLYPNSTSP